MNRSLKLYIAGHRGMVGSAVTRQFRSSGYDNIITRELNELDLTRQEPTEKFFNEVKPEAVIVAAAKVGGILANNIYRAEFIYDNLMIEANIIHAAHMSGVKKLIFLGSSCIYPRLAPQPMKEEYLLSDYLEYTNEPYAVAKIAGIKLCENYYKQYGSNFYSVMPTNMYGPFDNYDLEKSHVLPALIRKFHEAKVGKKTEVIVWGTGKPLREFLYVEDLADALMFLMENVNAEDLYGQNITHLNIGTGEDLSIMDLALLVKNITGFEGKIIFDSTKPDGTPRKLMDVSRMSLLGWKSKTTLNEGIQKAYNWFLENYKQTEL
jgi:GDP-L-fucose synthase